MGGEITNPIKRLGAWLARVDNTVYQADTDGFVAANGVSDSNADVKIITDSGTPPTITRQHQRGIINDCVSCCSSLIKKDDYWKAENAGSTLYWVPLEP